MEFFYSETRETVTAKERPIVIITSNAEKELPDAFLRRCTFHYIAFSEPSAMEEIVRVHFDSLDETLLRQAMAAFYMIRNVNGIQKKPSTSELIDWLRALQLGGVDPSVLSREIPYSSVLLKKTEDLEKIAPPESKMPWHRS